MKTGILNRATSAKATNEQKTAEEELKLGVSALSIDYRKNTTNSQTFKEFVTSNSGANLKTAMGLETTNADLVVENAENGIVSYKGQKYQVDDYGGVAEYVPSWIQNKTEVTKDGVTLEVGQAVNGYSVTANIGGTETTVNNWYVLGAKDGKLLLTTNTCPEQVTLGGKDGYTGGVALLNSTAEKYTNSQFADGNARSINVDDINRVTGYKPEVERYNEGKNTIDQWNNKLTYTLVNEKIYTKGTKYPIYNENEIGCEPGTSGGNPFSSFEYFNGSIWIKLGENGNAIKSEQIENTYYTYSPKLTTNSAGNDVGIISDSMAYNLLFANTGVPWSPTGKYWLASNCVLCGPGYVYYCLRSISGELVSYDMIKNSWEESGGCPSDGLRPVVTLKSDVNVTRSGDTVVISI